MIENPKILVVDDEEIIRDVLKEYLESKKSCHVLTAKDGREALEIIYKEEIDCCFTDISMPRMDGLELAQKINLYNNTIPIVVMTGYPSFENAINTMRHGVVDFLTKPFGMDELGFVVERVMRGRALLVDNILLKEEANKKEKLIGINQELRSKIRELETINLILRKLDGVTTSKDLLNILVNLSGEVTSCDEAHFCVISPEMWEPTIIASFSKKKKQGAILNVDFIEEGILRRIADDGMSFLIKGNNGNGSIMAIPLKIRSKVFGILLSVIRNGKLHFNERELFFLNFLAEKASSLIENMALYENIYENLFSTLYAFVEAIEARDPYTKQHSTRVSIHAMSIADAMGVSKEDMDRLNVSGNLHDIGKIGIPDRILLKPGRLTDEEYDFIKKHPIIGSNIIGHLGMWMEEQNIIKHHHERWEGNGYPDGLQGDEIPFLSRILAVADTYDALTSDRSYRRKMSDEVAADIIRENAHTQFDPQIVEVFLDLFDQEKFKTPSFPEYQNQASLNLPV